MGSLLMIWKMLNITSPAEGSLVVLWNGTNGKTNLILQSGDDLGSDDTLMYWYNW